MRVYDWARAHLVIGGVDFGVGLARVEPEQLAEPREPLPCPTAHFVLRVDDGMSREVSKLVRARVKRARKNARRLAEMRLVLVEARGGVPPLLVEDIAAAEAAISRAVLGNLDPNTVAPARSLAVPWWGR